MYLWFSSHHLWYAHQGIYPSPQICCLCKGCSCKKYYLQHLITIFFVLPTIELFLINLATAHQLNHHCCWWLMPLFTFGFSRFCSSMQNWLSQAKNEHTEAVKMIWQKNTEPIKHWTHWILLANFTFLNIILQLTLNDTWTVMTPSH